MNNEEKNLKFDNNHPLHEKLPLYDDSNPVNFMNLSESFLFTLWISVWRCFFQRPRELTNNLLVLFLYETIFNISIPLSGWTTGYFGNITSTYLRGAEPLDFTAWSAEYWLALGIYRQLGSAFGSGVYQEINKIYRTESFNLVSNQDEIDMFIHVSSRVTKFNLLPLFNFWGWPVSSGMLTQVDDLGLEYFLPHDEITTHFANRTSFILTQYTNVERVPRKITTSDPKEMVDVNDILSPDVVELV